MPVITKRPGTIKQPSSTIKNRYKQWGYKNEHSLDRLKKGRWISCGYHSKHITIAGKSGTYNRPAPLILTDFGFNIPTNSRIDKIILKYYDTKKKYGAHFPETYIKFNKGKIYKGGSVKGELTQKTIVIDVAKEKWTVKDVNNLKIGLKYAPNSKGELGRIWLKNLTVTVHYTQPKYNLLIQNIPKEVKVKNDFDLTFKITNVNKVNYNPTTVINIPAGLTFLKKIKGDGSVKHDGNKVYWNSGVNNKNLNKTVVLRFKANRIGTHNLTFQTQPSGYSNIAKASIKCTQRVMFSVLTLPVVNIKANEECTFSFKVEEDTLFENTDPVNIQIKGEANTEEGQVKFELQKGEEYIDITDTVTRSEIEDIVTSEPIYNYQWTPKFSKDNLTRVVKVTVKPAPNVTIGQFNIQIYFLGELKEEETINITPSNIGTVNYTGIILDDTETTPMSNGTFYNVQSNFYINDPNNHYSTELIDLGSNHRLGVYNQSPSLILEDINGHDKEWANNGFNSEIIIQDNTCTTLVPLGIDSTYSSNYLFNSFTDYNITFTYQHNHYPVDNELPFDMLDKKIVIGADEYTFEQLGITDSCTVELFINKKVLAVKIDDEEKQIGLIPNLQERYRFAFKAGESKSETYDESLTFTKFSIKELNKNYSHDELIEIAYNNITEWSKVLPKSNTWANTQIDFFYDENAPVIVIITGEPSNYYKDDVNLRFTQPVLHEDTNYEEEGNSYFDEEDPNFLQPLDFVRTNESASLSGNSNEMIFYDFNELQINDPNLVFTGIGLRFDCTGENTISIVAGVEVNGEKGYRSRVIDFEEDNEEEDEIGYDSDDQDPEETLQTIEIGGRWDSWGIDRDDLQEIDTLELSLKLQGQNLEEDLGSITIRNLRAVVYYNQLEEYPYTIKVDNVDTRLYGMFIKDIKIPIGINTENKYLNIEGTDINKPYNMSVKSKQITINFEIQGTPSNPEIEDGLIDAAAQLKQLNKLFMNPRTMFNKPILKQIRFSHLPGEYFEYIMENSIDNQAIIDSFAGSIVLNIPSGTSYSDKIKTTGMYGTTDSVINVKPIITVYNLTSHNIIIKEIHESIENNEIIESRMIIRDKSLNKDLKFDKDDYIKINCEDRTCMLYKWIEDEERYESHDIDNCVDFLSDWFILNGEYRFECNGATVYRVEFQERG